MLFSTKTITDLLFNSSRMFEIASTDPVIYNALLAINFTDPNIAALKATWTEANTAVETHKNAVEDQRVEKVKFQKTHRDAKALYMVHMQYVKSIVFNDPEKSAKMGLFLPRKRKLNDWLLQAVIFYANVLADPDLLIAMEEKYGETQASLEAAKLGIEGINTAKQAYMNAIGNCQAMRADRDDDLKKLEKTTKGFYAVLKRALKDNLQHLEKVKILVYSDGYKKKKTEVPPEEPPTGTDPQTTDPAADTTGDNTEPEPNPGQ